MRFRCCDMFLDYSGPSCFLFLRSQFQLGTISFYPARTRQSFKRSRNPKLNGRTAMNKTNQLLLTGIRRENRKEWRRDEMGRVQDQQRSWIKVERGPYMRQGLGGRGGPTKGREREKMSTTRWVRRDSSMQSWRSPPLPRIGPPYCPNYTIFMLVQNFCALCQLPFFSA